MTIKAGIILIPNRFAYVRYDVYSFDYLLMPPDEPEAFLINQKYKQRAFNLVAVSISWMLNRIEIRCRCARFMIKL